MAADTVPTIEAERDARALHGAEDGGHRIDPAEIAIGVIIGRTSEFFDFFVYALASVLVFPKLVFPHLDPLSGRSEEHTSELQSLMRISYAVFCLKKIPNI